MIHFTHTVEVYHPDIHPIGMEVIYHCTGQFIEEQGEEYGEHCWYNRRFELLSIRINGLELPTFGTGKDWRSFLSSIEESALTAEYLQQQMKVAFHDIITVNQSNAVEV